MGYLAHNVEEHDKAKKLAKKIENSKDDKEKRELFEEFYIMIYAHHNAEEEVIFPVVKNGLTKEDELDVVREMIEEHSLGAYQFSTVNKTFLENETWNAKFSTLLEVLDHHMEEEESQFTNLAKKVLSKEEDEDLLKKFETAMSKHEKDITMRLKA